MLAWMKQKNQECSNLAQFKYAGVFFISEKMKYEMNKWFGAASIIIWSL